MLNEWKAYEYLARTRTMVAWCVAYAYHGRPLKYPINGRLPSGASTAPFESCAPIMMDPCSLTCHYRGERKQCPVEQGVWLNQAWKQPHWGELSFE